MLGSMRRAGERRLPPLDEARLLARYRTTQHDTAAAAAAHNAVFDEGPPLQPAKIYAPAGGDFARLRGIPAIGRGVSGATPGSKPGQQL